MLFDVLGLVDETTARSIAFTVQALDPQAKITANLARGRLLVESNQDEHAISDALRAAGFPATLAPEHPEGSTCCGSCG
jgi:S-formylglutathione hydrolase FrmB